MPSRDSYYITTPIYYVNDSPHIGHAYTTLACDVLARSMRLDGRKVKFLTGTDEHGQKIEKSARAAGMEPQAFTDKVSQNFRDLAKAMNFSNDDFIRTTEPRHRRAVLELLQRCYDAGDIELGAYSGKYCVSCEEYYTDDELLPGGLCPIHRRPVETLSEENWFFRLSAFEQPLLEHYEANPLFVQPDGKRNEALGLIRHGLRDISISRTSIRWGVEVPWDPEHVFYVWYDALINYATAVGYGSDPERFAAWWPEAHHVIGKDILRFHCVYWPALLLAAGVEPPKRISVHGFLLVGGEKMSKTSLNQISPAELVEEFGVDGYRYHFLGATPFGPDGDFSYEGMVERYNSDLANNLGNLQARVATVVGKKCDGVGPAPRADSPLAEIAAQAYVDAAAAWDRVQPSQALDATWRLIRETNAHLEANEPWKADPGPEVDAVLGDALEALRIVTILASPAVPNTTAEIWRRLGLDGRPEDQRLPDAAAWGQYSGGLPVEKGDPLFPRLSA
jgi:methionyl-tRNA synthetase